MLKILNSDAKASLINQLYILKGFWQKCAEYLAVF